MTHETIGENPLMYVEGFGGLNIESITCPPERWPGSRWSVGDKGQPLGNHSRLVKLQGGDKNWKSRLALQKVIGI